jgi:hypothetical protein
MEQFRVLTGGRAIRENRANNTMLVSWTEAGQQVTYWFPKEEVVHVTSIVNPGLKLGVFVARYSQAISDINFRKDTVVNF